MASKLNPRASRLDLRPDLRVMMYPIKLDQREMAALAEINRQYRDGDIQVYTGTDRNTLARIVGAKTLDTGVEFLLGMDRASGRYLAAPVEWVEQVARMTAVAIDQGMIPEPPEDPEPPPMPRPKGRTPGRSAFPGGKMRNPRRNPSAQPCSGTTQVATTTGSYRKAAEMLKDFLAERPRARVLDYGAGLGLGTEAMRGVLDGIATVEGFEPLPGRAKVQPDYTDSRQIRAKYDVIVNLNVLNVLERGLRDRVLLDIANHLAPGGRAIIGTRKYKGDVDKAKGSTSGPEPGSIWLVKSGQNCYQKGFDGNELLEYASDLLGSGYRVRKLSGPAANNIEIERLGGSSRNPHPISPYSDPRLHDRIKDRILASDKGGRPGQWSARKAQLVAQAYEAAGGGYTGRKTSAQASLSRWTSQDWGTRSGKPSIQGPAATGERYLPRAVRESMPDKVYAASTRAKRTSIAAGRQFSPQPGPARAYTTLRRTRIA